MRGGILAVGIVLLIIGVFLFMAGESQKETYHERTEDYESIWGEVKRWINQDEQREYERAQRMELEGSSIQGMGFIFGVIGFVLCIGGVLAPSKKPQVTVQQPSQLDRRCPSCGRKIHFDAKICPYCGKKFKTHLKEEPGPQTEKEETKKDSKKKIKTPKFCPECGFKLEEEDLNFCPNCGTRLG